MFGWGIYDFLGGVYSRKIGSNKSLFWSQVAGLLFINLLAFFLGVRGQPTIRLALWCLLAAVLYAAGYLFFFKGFEKGNVSIVAATMNLWAVFTMLFAFIFMGQRLSTAQTISVCMIIFGATLASINHKGSTGENKFQISNGVKEAIIGAFFFGVYWNVSEIISEETGWLLSTLFIKMGIAFCLLVHTFLFRQGVGIKQSPLKVKGMILLMGCIEVTAVALVNYGLTISDAILITPIASALSIVTISLAAIFLKEKITGSQAFGIILAVAGIIMTAF